MGAHSGARVLTVGELNRYAKRKLDGWGEVWVVGEVSDVNKSNRGHLYFSLNDTHPAALIPCVMFLSDVQKNRTPIENGAQIRIHASFNLYEPRAKLQLTAKRAFPAGDGDRKEKLRQLKKKLTEEGLFDPKKKRALPLLPRTVAVVTSLSGAAFGDVCKVAAGRAPTRLVIAHCQVQGPEAPGSIVRALLAVYSMGELDVVILCRGGGASEDLQAFDEEIVVRTVAQSPVPIVTGIGHELDVSLADLAADVRAATPSNAAEVVVPDMATLRRELDEHMRTLQRALQRRFGQARLVLERLSVRPRQPQRVISDQRQALHLSARAAERAVRGRLSIERALVRSLERRLASADPRARLARDRVRHDELIARLHRTARAIPDAPRRTLSQLIGRLESSARRPLESRRAIFAARVAALDALSPLRVLGRGYAIALGADGKAIVDARDVATEDRITVRVHRGELEADVVSVQER